MQRVTGEFRQRAISATSKKRILQWVMSEFLQQVTSQFYIKEQVFLQRVTSNEWISTSNEQTMKSYASWEGYWKYTEKGEHWAL